MKQAQINELLVRLARQRGTPSPGSRAGTRASSAAEAKRRCICTSMASPSRSSRASPRPLQDPVSAGIPPTHRGMAASVTFVTAHEDPAKESGFLDWSLLAKEPGTIIFLMGARPDIRHCREAHGAGHVTGHPLRTGPGRHHATAAPHRLHPLLGR
ncbi:MAG: hypothetical protein MZU91_13420 [Desulfosudis oleivorans]|nr:hypothetical protein [Desulfosudis oleivorans]